MKKLERGRCRANENVLNTQNVTKQAAMEMSMHRTQYAKMKIVSPIIQSVFVRGGGRSER